MTRKDILERSLAKKQAEFGVKVAEHFEDVKAQQGEPWHNNSKSRANRNRRERAEQTLRGLDAAIEKTRAALEREDAKIRRVEAAKDILPERLLRAVEAGELTQWRKHPTFFFVPGVNKARLVWADGKLSARYLHLVTDPEARARFVSMAQRIDAEISFTLPPKD